jgi:hypothetical protein
MKRYQINKIELKFLDEVLTYLNQEDVTLSEEKAQQVQEVIKRISNRPVVDMIIDKKVLETTQTEETTHD